MGNVLEHVLMNRWKAYLEVNDLYPYSKIGFPSRLGTEVAMLQINSVVIDSRTRDNQSIGG